MINKDLKSWHKNQMDFTYLQYDKPNEVTEISATLYGSSMTECLDGLAKISLKKNIHTVKIFPIDKSNAKR